MLARQAAREAAAQARGQHVDHLRRLEVELRESVADVGACDYSEGVRQLCPRGDTEAPRTLVLIGDSHARAWIPAFDEIAATAGWRTFYLVKSQCTAAHVTVAPLDELPAT